jgi:hypothetical protein
MIASISGHRNVGISPLWISPQPPYSRTPPSLSAKNLKSPVHSPNYSCEMLVPVPCCSSLPWNNKRKRFHDPRHCIDYWCEYGRFPMSASCVTISNPDSLSGSATGVNPGKRSWRSTYLNELDVRKPMMVSISQRSEELRLHYLVWNLTIPNPGSKVVSSNASPCWTVRFLVAMIWFSERRSQDLSSC